MFSFSRLDGRDVGPKTRVEDPKQFTSWAEDLALVLRYRLDSFSVRAVGIRDGGH
jgi:hypothetical protein